MSYPIDQKLNFVTALTSISSTITTAYNTAISLENDWNDHGYSAGGADPIIADDLVDSAFEGLPVADLTAGIVALQQLIKYMSNQAVVQGDYLKSYTDLKS